MRYNTKVQCSQCLLHWNQGIVYCFCGQCLIYSEPRRKFNKLRLDAISFPDCLIKKGATHGARHGKTEVQRFDSQGEHVTGLHDRFLRDPVYRESQLAIGWSEQKCNKWDEICKRRPYISSHPRGKEKIPRTMVSHFEQMRQKWHMKLRSDYRAAVLMKNRLHHESGEQVEEPISPEQYQIRHPFSSTVNTIHPAPEIHEHFMIQQATEHCVQLHAQSQQS